MITTASSLADIVRHSPASAGIFHQHGLDYCCGGKATLEYACAERGIDVDLILSKVVAAKDSDLFGSIHPELWDTSFLISYIVNNHHRFLRTALPLAYEQMQRVEERHGSRFPEAEAIVELVEDLRVSLLEHLDEEENGVFAVAITASTANGINNEITNHEKSHSDVGLKLQRLRALTHEFVPPPDACATHRSGYDSMRNIYEDTMQHVYLENALLFPRMLTDIHKFTAIQLS